MVQRSKRRHHVDVAFDHQTCGRLIHQITVLDATHTAFDRAADRPRCVSMRHDVSNDFLDSLTVGKNGGAGIGMNLSVSQVFD